MSSEADLFGVFEMPYLVKDRKHMQRIEKELFWSKIEPEAEKKGLKVLAVWENGYRHITNNKHPINVPADLKGIKLRVPEGKWRVKMFQAYGANPCPMKFSEVFTALQTGVMDGQENPFTQIYSAKFHEVQKYLSLTGHVYTPAYVDRGHQEVGDAAGRRAQDPRGHRQGDAGVRLREGGEATTTSCCEKLKAAGIQVNNAQQGRVHRRVQARLRGVRQGSAGLEGSHRPSHRAREVDPMNLDAFAGATSASSSGWSSSS